MSRAALIAILLGALAVGATSAMAQETVSLAPAGSATFPERSYRLTVPERRGLNPQDVTVTENGDPVGKIAWRPLGYIIGANLLFGVLLGGIAAWGLPAMGLVAAIYALVLIAGLAGEKYSVKESLVLATILAVGSYVAFVILLKLQFQVWPTFITG